MAAEIDLQRLAQFKYAIVNFLGEDGFPWSLPTEFRITPQHEILLRKPSSSIPLAGRRVGVLFNSITALPTGGYTDRKYMLVWGRLAEQDSELKVHPESLSEWDEKMLSFPEYCARSAPQGQKYLESLQPQLEA